MQFDREPTTGIYISSFDPGILRLTDREVNTPVILTATKVIDTWTPPVVAEMSIDDFAVVLEQRPELLLLGSGPGQLFPPAELGMQIMQAGIGFEVMDTRAACRTFNVLVGEGRRVMAALLLD